MQNCNSLQIVRDQLTSLREPEGNVPTPGRGLDRVPGEVRKSIVQALLETEDATDLAQTTFWGDIQYLLDNLSQLYETCDVTARLEQPHVYLSCG